MSIESNICKRAVEVFGADRQRLKLFEEVGELQQAIAKYELGLEKGTDHIAEEIADVEIMLEQLKCMYKCHSRFNYWKARKLNRLTYLIEDAEKAGCEQWVK